VKEFIVDHYLLIMIVAAFLIFALIGYIIDTARNNNKGNNVNELKEENTLLTENLVPDIQPEVEEPENNTEEISPQITDVESDNTKNDFVLTEPNNTEDPEPVKNSEEAKDNK